PIDRLAAEQDRAALDVHEAQQQPRQRRLSAARTPDQSHARARRNAERELLEQQRLARAVPEIDVAHLDSEMRRAQWLRGRWIADAWRIEQELGKLCRVGQRALEVPIDAVELPHHPRGGAVVAERQEHGLEADAGAVSDGERDE